MAVIEPIEVIEKVAEIVESVFAPDPIRIHHDDLLGKKKEILAAYFKNEVDGAVVSTHGWIVRGAGNYETRDNNPALSLELAGFYGFSAGLTALDWQNKIHALRVRFDQPNALGIAGIYTDGLKFPPRSIGEMDSEDEEKLHFAFGMMEVFAKGWC